MILYNKGMLDCRNLTEACNATQLGPMSDAVRGTPRVRCNRGVRDWDYYGFWRGRWLFSLRLIL